MNYQQQFLINFLVLNTQYFYNATKNRRQEQFCWNGRRGMFFIMQNVGLGFINRDVNAKNQEEQKVIMFRVIRNDQQR